MSTQEEPNSGMRKRIVSRNKNDQLADAPEWLPIAELARVEVTSEAPANPIEHALLPQYAEGWQADAPGPQCIRLVFDRPQAVHRVFLHFVEDKQERRQEFVLRTATSPNAPREEIVRQQWNFSPSGSVHETEDYRLDGREITFLELEILPAVEGGDARASLHQFFLA